jgi:hypothetical protein
VTLQWIEDSGSRAATIKRLGLKDTSTIDVRYKCLGTYNDLEVHNQANIFFSTNRFYSVNGMTFLVDSYDVQHLGGDAWEVAAHYVCEGATDQTRPDPMKRSRQFDTTGGTAHISAGFDERRYGSGAPDMKKAIAVDGDAVNGVDVTVPALQWSESYDVPHAAVSSAWIRGVAGLTGCVNSAAFRGFEAEEVLFVGCSGSQQWDQESGNGPWSLTFKFVASQNQTGLTIGDVNGVVKKGHDYLWVTYEKSVDSGFVVQRPKFVYCTRVYRKESFSALGIGS